MIASPCASADISGLPFQGVSLSMNLNSPRESANVITTHLRKEKWRQSESESTKLTRGRGKGAGAPHTPAQPGLSVQTSCGAPTPTKGTGVAPTVEPCDSHSSKKWGVMPGP